MHPDREKRAEQFLKIQKQFLSYAGDLDEDHKNTEQLISLIDECVSKYVDDPEEARLERLRIGLGLSAQMNQVVSNNFQDARDLGPVRGSADFHAGRAALVNMTGICSYLLKQDSQE